MPDASVICVKPRTLTNILPFENLQDDEIIARSEVALLASIAPINIKLSLDKIRERFERTYEIKGSFHYNGNQYGFSKQAEECGEEEVIVFGDGDIKYIDGILQDQATGELFYFLAIDSEGVNAEQIDEGSVIEYNKEYKGVAEINLYKGNSGHYEARKELLKNYQESNESEQIKQDDPDPSPATLEPIRIKGEIVRYVEVIKVRE